jgi:copper chaperone
MELKFKTNINCQNCVRAVSGFLNEDKSILQWEVDTATADKILSVKGEQLNAGHIIELVEEAGFDIKPA